PSCRPRRARRQAWPSNTSNSRSQASEHHAHPRSGLRGLRTLRALAAQSAFLSALLASLANCGELAGFELGRLRRRATTGEDRRMRDARKLGLACLGSGAMPDRKNKDALALAHHGQGQEPHGAESSDARAEVIDQENQPLPDWVRYGSAG